MTEDPGPHDDTASASTVPNSFSRWWATLDKNGRIVFVLLVAGILFAALIMVRDIRSGTDGAAKVPIGDVTVKASALKTAEKACEAFHNGDFDTTRQLAAKAASEDAKFTELLNFAKDLNGEFNQPSMSDVNQECGDWIEPAYANR